MSVARKITPIHETKIKEGRIVIIIDTRETKPIACIEGFTQGAGKKGKKVVPGSFRFSNNVYVGSCALSVGDYMVGVIKNDGSIETRMLIERKELPDLRATLKDDTRRRNLEELITIGKHTGIITPIIIEGAQKKISKFQEQKDGTLKCAQSAGMTTAEVATLMKTLGNIALNSPLIMSFGVANTLKQIEDLAVGNIEGRYKVVDLPRTPSAFYVDLFGAGPSIVMRGNHPGVVRRPPPMYFGIDQVNSKYLNIDKADIIMRDRQVQMGGGLSAFIGHNKVGEWVGFLYDSYLNLDSHTNSCLEVMTPMIFNQQKVGGMVLNAKKLSLELPRAFDSATFESQLIALEEADMVGPWTRYEHLFVVGANLYSIMNKTTAPQTMIAPLTASSSWPTTMVGLLALHYLTLRGFNIDDLDMPIPIGLGSNLIERQGTTDVADIVVGRLGLVGEDVVQVKKILSSMDEV